MKNINGRPLEQFRAHLGVRVGPTAKGKEVTTITDEMGELELCPVGVFISFKDGREDLVPFSNITQLTFLRQEEMDKRAEAAAEKVQAGKAKKD